GLAGVGGDGVVAGAGHQGGAAGRGDHHVIAGGRDRHAGLYAQRIGPRGEVQERADFEVVGPAGGGMDDQPRVEGGQVRVVVPGDLEARCVVQRQDRIVQFAAAAVQAGEIDDVVGPGVELHLEPV